MPENIKVGPEMIPSRVSHEELMSLVDGRHEEVRLYLEWALANERLAAKEATAARSMRMAARTDLQDAAEASEWFPQRWWGVVVFSCFGSKLGAKTVAPYFLEPLQRDGADAIVETIQ